MSKNQVFNGPVNGGVGGRDVNNYTIVHAVFEDAATWGDFHSDALNAHFSAERAVFWQAWRRYWFNVPAMLLLILLVTLGIYLFALLAHLSIVDMTHTETGKRALTFYILMQVAVLPLVIWLNRIRRVEGMVTATAQANMDGINQVLRRRRGR